MSIESLRQALGFTTNTPESLRKVPDFVGTLDFTPQTFDLEAAFQSAGKARVAAFIITRDPIFLDSTRQIADLAMRYRLPSIGEGSEFIDAGCLLSYSTNLVENSKRAAFYVDRILKGAKPGDLPVEQPTRFDLIVNKTTADKLGIKIPNSILVRADKVIG